MANFRDVWSSVVGQMKRLRASHGAGGDGMDANVVALLARVADADPAAAIQILQSHAKGISFDEAASRLESFGRNSVAHERPIGWFERLLGNFKNPFIVVLLVLGGVSFATGDLRAGVVVTIMVAVSVLMRFFQEHRSSNAALALQAMVRNTATVTRRQSVEQENGDVFEIGHKLEIPFEDVVPGDLIHLAAGDMVPADVRLISSKDLFISESALTGESMPVEKMEAPSKTAASILERSNLCFLGTNVVSGTAQAVVVSTGERTFFGSLAKNVVGQRTLTSFDKGVNGVTWLLVRFMFAMVPLVFLSMALRKELDRSLSLCGRGGRRPDSRNAADDRDGESRQGRLGDVEEESDRKAPEFHSKLWRDGRALHR